MTEDERLPPADRPADDEGTPRWVWISAAAALLLLALVLVVHLAGGGMGPHG